jgi:hypothetical protein
MPINKKTQTEYTRCIVKKMIPLIQIFSKLNENKKIILIPEDPVFGTWYYLRFINYFLEVVPGTKYWQKNFEKFSRPKNKVLASVQLPKKNFF